MTAQPLSVTGHYEHKVGAMVYPVLPGDHLVLSEPGVAISTLLGSCVAACIRDRASGRGGLNHFLLPGTDKSQSKRYGVYAMEVLINEVLAEDGDRSRLEAKVFGAGEVIGSSGAVSVGMRNAQFVKEYLRGEGIRVLAEDLGGELARRVFYFPDTGVVRVQYLSPMDSRTAVEGEVQLEKKLIKKPQTGTVELFQ